MISVATVVEPSPRGSEPTIVNGYVTELVGSVKDELQYGTVFMVWNGVTPPAVANMGVPSGSGLAAGVAAFAPASVVPGSSAATRATAAPPARLPTSARKKRGRTESIHPPTQPVGPTHPLSHLPP